MKKQEPERPDSGFMEKVKNVKLINVETAMYYFSDMEEMYKKTLQVFCSTIITEIGKMKTYIDEGNLAMFKTRMHGIKTSLLSIGAAELSASARELEKHANSGDLQLCKQQYPPFYEQMTELNKQLEIVFS